MSKTCLQNIKRQSTSLTINEENRLKIKVQLLESEKTNYEKLDAKIDALKRDFLKNEIMVGPPDSTEEEGKWRPMTEQEIEDDIQWERVKRNARRKRDKELMQEISDEEKGKKKKEIKTLVKHKTVN